MFYLQINDELKLSMVHQRDAKELFRLIDNSREHLSTYLDWVNLTRDDQATKGFIENALKMYAEGKEIHCAIWYQGQLAGIVGYHTINHGIKAGEIGYWLGKEFEGKGIMTKAVEAMLKYGFEYLDLNKVEITCAVENLRSQAIPRRLGFTEEGVPRQATIVQGQLSDLILFGKLKSEHI